MCYHAEDELLREIRYWNNNGLRNVSGVAIYDDDGEFVGSWLCFADQPQSIANAVHVLRTWHPEANSVDLSYVDRWREYYQMPAVMAATLPPPTVGYIEGVTDEDTPERTRAILTQWLDSARAAAYERA